MTPSSIGETGPPVLGRADAEAVALAVGLAVAVALMLADAVGLAVAVALMLADALLLADALDMALALDIALALDMAEDEALDIIMLSSPISCAIAAGAKANAATMHRAANNRNFLKVPPSIDFLSPGSTCTFPSGGHVSQNPRPPSMYVSRLPNTRCSVGKSFVKQHVGVEYGTLRLVLDQEGVRADEATGVPHLADTDSGTRAAAKGTKALRCACAWPQEAFREGQARQKVKPALS
jgi:hypothetical protein